MEFTPTLHFPRDSDLHLDIVSVELMDVSCPAVGCGQISVLGKLVDSLREMEQEIPIGLRIAAQEITVPIQGSVKGTCKLFISRSYFTDLKGSKTVSWRFSMIKNGKELLFHGTCTTYGSLSRHMLVTLFVETVRIDQQEN